MFLVTVIVLKANSYSSKTLSHLSWCERDAELLQLLLLFIGVPNSLYPNVGNDVRHWNRLLFT